MILFRLRLIQARIIAWWEDWFNECPREKMGYSCHMNSKNYGYKCESCGRSAK